MRAGFLHQLLEQSARKCPSKEAGVYKGDRLSYQEVNERANLLARRLIEWGVERGDRVGIYLEKGVEEVVSIFAISKARGVCVILNPALKSAQVSHRVKDCGMKGIVSQANLFGAVAPGLAAIRGLKFCVLVRGGAHAFSDSRLKVHSHAQVSGAGKDNLNLKAPDSALAAILYTSGSTGLPKGVMLSHRNMVLGARSCQEYLRIRARDRILCLLPFSFDYGLNQLVTAFSVGATAVVLKFLFSQDAIELIHRERISGLAGIPTLWMQLLGAPNIARYRFKGLRYITNSGGALPTPALQDLRRRFPNAKVYLMYGFTEAFRATYLDPKELDRRPGSIGKAVPYAKVSVVTEEGNPCGPNKIGELIQHGELVSQGYWGDPRGTAKVFKRDPFAASSNRRACFSGDYVKRDDKGYFWFVGRKDDLIKSSGYRISPTEIEDALYRDTRIREAVAFGMPDPVLGQKIGVAVTLKKKGALSEREIINYCTRHLPVYMTPNQVRILSRMPLTPNGKVDSKRVRGDFGIRAVPNAVVIGEGRMGVECLKILQGLDCRVVGVVTARQKGSEWTGPNLLAQYASSQGLKTIVTDDPNRSAVVQKIRTLSPNILFSVRNPWILSKELISIPDRGVINFHSGPLPEYAGMNVCSWALYNGEKQHGITWHAVDAGIDSGDILYRKRFPILARYNATHLIFRCIEEGIKSFKEIAPLILSGRINRAKQEKTHRAVYGTKARIRTTIRFGKDDVQAILRMKRAVDFHPFKSPFGIPALKNRSKRHLIDKMMPLRAGQRYKRCRRGEIVRIDKRGVWVKAKGGTLCINQFLDGKSLSPQAAYDYTRAAGLKVGDICE